MSIKDFFKSISIYGMIPVVGKFISALLLPLYTRILSLEDYGAQDILTQIAFFITALGSLEICGGVGRYFFSKKSLIERRQLISTGLISNIFITIFVLLTTVLANNYIYKLFFRSTEYSTAFNLTIIWGALSVISGYFITIMRFERRDKFFFIINNIQLALRILSTVFFVAIIKMGVTGVILGHIVGDLCGIVMLSIPLRKYFGFYFKISDLRKIISYSFPMVPAILIISFEKPLTRFLVSHYLDTSDMGLYSIALQMASVLMLVQYGFKMAWHPHLFQMSEKNGFEKDIERIYKAVFSLLTVFTVLVMLNGRLMLAVLVTPAFFAAAPLIGFVLIKNMLDIISQISRSGIGLSKKTKYVSYIELVTLLFNVLVFIALHKYIGILGLAISMMLCALIKFVWGWILTKKYTQINFSMLKTYLTIVALFLLSFFYAFIKVPIWVSLVMSIIYLLVVFIREKDKISQILHFFKAHPVFKRFSLPTKNRII